MPLSSFEIQSHSITSPVSIFNHLAVSFPLTQCLEIKSPAGFLHVLKTNDKHHLVNSCRGFIHLTEPHVRSLLHGVLVVVSLTQVWPEEGGSWIKSLHQIGLYVMIINMTGPSPLWTVSPLAMLSLAV